MCRKIRLTQAAAVLTDLGMNRHTYLTYIGSSCPEEKKDPAEFIPLRTPAPRKATPDVRANQAGRSGDHPDRNGLGAVLQRLTIFRLQRTERLDRQWRI